MNGTRVFHYGHAPVRVRVRGGEPVWFVRDLTAALGTPAPAGPLLPASVNALPGIATAAQVWLLVERAGCRVSDSFRAWMTDVSTRVLTAPAPQPARVPHARPRPIPVRRTA
ncbi:hypothetical protein ACFUJY_29635 [Streptomyces sp. NPDC057249]|uniref:hypothetical protein n=1 Tax=Streptomyces sp. NPDC057249 TaxID=3346067 RepID=UPI003630167B